ncbi:MAG: phospholipase D family protein [Burkholderiaceae bacterium]
MDIGFLARILVLLVIVLLAGCGALPAQVNKSDSYALPPASEGTLVRMAKDSTPSPEQSGFRLIPLGVYSLDARMYLIERAEHSLDLQYYVIENDASGRMLLRSLRDAARRGVRVRLLVDDLFTANTEHMLRALAAEPNVQVRLFNPFCCARGHLLTRFVASLTDLGRLNHRMHNKLFLADGVMAIAGGRNIADEYFTRNPQQNFVDMDAFVIGSVVSQLGEIFDRYWNSEPAYPVEALVPAAAIPQQLNQQFDDLVGMDPPEPLDLPPVDMLGYGPISEDLDAGRIGLVWGTAYAYADPPSKVMKDDPRDALATSVTMNVMDLVRAAKTEVVVTSPYLIPGPDGMDVIRNLKRNQVKLTILTNSLAATDSPLVHIGYARYRSDMLREGVDLYELSPARTVRNKRLGLRLLSASSVGRLHTKTLVIDRNTVFIGSMNLDPRSASKNTELGIVADNPQLAREMLRVVNIGKLQSAYRVRLAADGQALEWLTMDEEQETVLTAEPESSFWTRLQTLILNPLVPEELL